MTSWICKHFRESIGFGNVYYWSSKLCTRLILESPTSCNCNNWKVITWNMCPFIRGRGLVPLAPLGYKKWTTRSGISPDSPGDGKMARKVFHEAYYNHPTPPCWSLPSILSRIIMTLLEWGAALALSLHWQRCAHVCVPSAYGFQVCPTHLYATLGSQ